jgi:hypothetical protein
MCNNSKSLAKFSNILQHFYRLHADVYADYILSELKRSKILSMEDGFRPCSVDTIPAHMVGVPLNCVALN